MTVAAIGLLREDIYLSYNFSTPLTVPEANTNVLFRAIGGSVYNTCRYLALSSTTINVSFFTLNYPQLIKVLAKSSVIDNMLVFTPKSELFDYPTSIVGLKENGEKQIISYDPTLNYDDLLLMFENAALKADIIFTSLYEVNMNNLAMFSNIFINCLKNRKTIMIDLCPFIKRFSKETIKDILANATIISGNNDEFNELLMILELNEISELFSVFMSINSIFVKKGELGAALFERKENKIVRIFQKASSNLINKNTTGCGDVFNACILHGLCNNDDCSEMLRNAVTESALVAKEGLPWIKMQ